MTDRPEPDIHQQTAFGEDGQLEVTELSIETSLACFGADIGQTMGSTRSERRCPVRPQKRYPSRGRRSLTDGVS